MYFSRGSITFLATFLIMGLKNHFTDGFIEHAAGPIKRNFEMEFFREYDKMYQNCQESLKNTEAKETYENIYQNQIRNKDVPVDKIAKFLQMELTCIRKTDDEIPKGGDARPLAIMWFIQFLANDSSFVFLRIYATYREVDSEIAGKFLRLAVYLAAFGANESTGTLPYDGIKYYIHKGKYKYKREEEKYIFLEDIPYKEFVTQIRDITYPYYDPTNNTLNIESSELNNKLTAIEMNSRLINSYLEFAMLGENVHYLGYDPEPHPAPAYDYNKLWNAVVGANENTGQSSQSSEYDFKVLWDSVWAIDNSLSEWMNSDSVPQDAMFGPSKIIELLRTVEIFKFRQDRPNIPSDEINEIIKGFNNEARLITRGVELSSNLKILIFGRNPVGTQLFYLANGSHFSDRLAHIYHELKKQ